MRDTIVEDDMLMDVTKTELENRLIKGERECEMIREEFNEIKKQSVVMAKLIEASFGSAGELSKVFEKRKR